MCAVNIWQKCFLELAAHDVWVEMQPSALISNQRRQRGKDQHTRDKIILHKQPGGDHVSIKRVGGKIARWSEQPEDPPASGTTPKLFRNWIRQTDYLSK